MDEHYNSTTDKPYSATNNYITQRDNSSKATDTGSGVLGYAQVGVSLISTIADLWSTHEQNKIAKETLSFNKDQYAKQYDSFLSDRARRLNRQNSLQDSYNRANGIKDDSHWRVGANPAGEGHDTIGRDGTNYSQMSESERNVRTRATPEKQKVRKLDMNSQAKPMTTSKQINQKTRRL